MKTTCRLFIQGYLNIPATGDLEQDAGEEEEDAGGSQEEGGWYQGGHLAPP
jgi:hypothetical protein